MKRYIRSSSDFSEFTEADKALWESIDWKARNYEEYEVPEDSFRDTCAIYGVGDEAILVKANFVKVIRPNPIFPPYYRPSIDNNSGLDHLISRYNLVGPMANGVTTSDGYDIHNRYETQELYDQLSR